MGNAVAHPDHYGGASNPYEVIKVLEASMTPEEFHGFCKGNTLKYTIRARQKGGAEDYAKAAWYAQRLVDFIARQRAAGEPDGMPVAAPEPVYWGVTLISGDVGLHDDAMDVAREVPPMKPFLLFSSIEPHLQWAVAVPIGEQDGDDVVVTDVELKTFSSREAAAAFCECDQPEGVPSDARWNPERQSWCHRDGEWDRKGARLRPPGVPPEARWSQKDGAWSCSESRWDSNGARLPDVITGIPSRPPNVPPSAYFDHVDRSWHAGGQSWTAEGTHIPRGGVLMSGGAG